MLIKTDSKNYTDIANAIREVTGVASEYKPAEMLNALQSLFVTYGVSYDSFDSNGNVLEATTYGNRVYGLGGHNYLSGITISKQAKSVAPFAFSASGMYANKTVLSLPNGIETIEKHGLANTHFRTIELPDSITEIGEWGISTNILLKSIKLSKNINAIPVAAFSGNMGLKELTIPASVISINMLAFMLCFSLETVTFLGTPTYIDTTAFESCSDLTTINVPWSEGEVKGAPWGATNATINYNYTTE